MNADHELNGYRTMNTLNVAVTDTAGNGETITLAAYDDVVGIVIVHESGDVTSSHGCTPRAMLRALAMTMAHVADDMDE